MNLRCWDVEDIIYNLINILRVLMEAENKKELLKICMEKGFLLDREMLEIFSELEEDEARKVIESIEGLGIGERVITKTVFSKNMEKIRNFVDGKSKMIMEKFFINFGYERTELAETKKENDKKIKLISAPNIIPKKVCVDDFVKYFRIRYNTISKILQMRQFDNLTSIRRISGRGNYTIIAAVFDKRITKNKNLMLEVEDLSGSARILINQNKKEVYNKAKDLLLDDIVAFSVSGDSEWLYANDVIFPDCMLHEKKKHVDDVWVAFTSDLHVGSKMFLEKEIMKFVKWINLEDDDNKQKEIAKKVKYLFLLGDNVDGVGVYPNQNFSLEFEDIRDQYRKLTEILNKIRKDIKIIICPGQHDAVRVAEPQPMIGEEYAPELNSMENVVLVTNPCLIEIEGGFRILMYHGAGMHTFAEEIEDIRLNYGHNNPPRVVKEILKRRHLCPTHSAVTYIPTEKEDALCINQVPDIVATGDWHRCEVGTYNNILLVSGSCWQSKTPFEEKVGNEPDPCKVPLFNLKTREIKILDFSDENFVEGKIEND